MIIPYGTLSLTFTNPKHDLIDTPLTAPDGEVHFTLSTMNGMLGRKITTITSTSGLVGTIHWRENSFSLDGVQVPVKDLKTKSGGLLSREREWKWKNWGYKLKYHDWEKELRAVPTHEHAAGNVSFWPYRPLIYKDGDLATIQFPEIMKNEEERLFALMAILYTDMERQDNNMIAGHTGGKV
ncbi:hypothetical protein FB45DRAFT_874481 [Roridomyces roridus]|uniref:Uncharacterized protein n=1 Tax=Roridomyces roridus TaxID=1738132 RepID=A0AAD7FDD8_9AGAR|nr:hypothetical protein FB45DRAFT_874481 [Roridomyces roridus]